MFTRIIWPTLVVAVSACFSLTSTKADEPQAAYGSTTQSFPVMDTNKDERLSYEEYKQWYEPWLRRHFRTMDKDGDGAVDLQEFRERQKSRIQIQSTESKEKPLGQ